MNTQKIRRELERDLKTKIEALHRTPQFKAVQTAEEKIARFQEFFENEKGGDNNTPATPAPKRTRSTANKTPAPKANGRKPAAKKANKGTGPKAKTPKATKTPKVKVTSSTKISEGRQAVSRGDRPKMKEAVATIIGKGQMSANEVVEGLKTRGWLPDSDNPRQYMSYVLSTHKDTFEAVSRGIYRVKSGVNFPKKSSRKVDSTLAEVGIENGNVGSNPFSSATPS